MATAGGRNPDVLGGFQAIAAREPRRIPRPLRIHGNSLGTSCRRFPFSLILWNLISRPAKTASWQPIRLWRRPYCSARAYANALDISLSFPRPFLKLSEKPRRRILPCTNSHAQFDGAVGGGKTLVLHGPSTRSAAVDLESKFTEAALGNVQLADFRNFAHGRHHWLAKKALGHHRSHRVSHPRRTSRRACALWSSFQKVWPLFPYEIPFSRIVRVLGRARPRLADSGPGRHRRGASDPGRPGVPRFGRADLPAEGGTSTHPGLFHAHS